MNYNNKKFRPIANTENGETSEETIFEYKQNGNVLTSEYKGGQIIKGHLIGLVDDKGNINMRYHQVNTKGELMTRVCTSKTRNHGFRANKTSWNLEMDIWRRIKWWSIIIRRSDIIYQYYHFLSLLFTRPVKMQSVYIETV